jgi:hypothetical protein
MDSFLFLEGFLDKESHVKVLVKKISANLVIQEAFQEYMIDKNIITKDMLSQTEYLSDFLLLNILDQMWIQEVYEPHLPDIMRALATEIRMSHDLERLHTLFTKKTVLLKAYKLIKAIELN